MSDVAVAGVMTLLLVGIIVLVVLVVFLTSKPKKKSVTKTKKVTPKPRKIAAPPNVAAKPAPKSTLYQPCTSSGDCSAIEHCAPSRMYYLQDYDVDEMESDDLVGMRMSPFAIQALETNRWSVTDVLDFQDNLIVATDTKNVIVVDDLTNHKVVQTNIKIDELAVYQDQLYARAGEKLYSMPFAAFYHPTWQFELSDMNDDGQVLYIESSRDRTVLCIGADHTRVYVNGELETKEDFSRKVLGNEAGQYAQANGNHITVYPNDAELANGSTGVFTDENRFFKLSNHNRNWIKRLRLVSNQPMAISQRVCITKGLPAQDIHVI